MIAVTAFNGFLSWKQDAELLALYAIVGGFSTPLLISTGENHEVALFSICCCSTPAVLLLVALKPWSRLLCAAFAGTVFFFADWSFQYYGLERIWDDDVFPGVLLLDFRLGAAAGTAARGRRRAARWLGRIWRWRWCRWPTRGLGFLGFYLMLESAENSGDAAPWVAVAFAAFYLLLLRFPARGVIHGSAAATSTLHLTIAVVFLTIAIPLKTHGRWLTIGWLAEGGALVWLARRTRLAAGAGAGGAVPGAGVVALVMVNPAASTDADLQRAVWDVSVCDCGLRVCGVAGGAGGKHRSATFGCWRGRSRLRRGWR